MKWCWSGEQVKLASVVLLYHWLHSVVLIYCITDYTQYLVSDVQDINITHILSKYCFTVGNWNWNVLTHWETAFQFFSCPAVINGVFSYIKFFKYLSNTKSILEKFYFTSLFFHLVNGRGKKRKILAKLIYE